MNKPELIKYGFIYILILENNQSTIIPVKNQEFYF